MAKKVVCPGCGAKNAPEVRRCRICTRVINPEGEDVAAKPKGLPEHVQRQIDKVVPQEETGGFGSLPTPPAGGGTAGDAWSAGDTWGSFTPPADGGSADAAGTEWGGGATWGDGDTWGGGENSWGDGEDAWDAEGGIVIDAAPRNPGVLDGAPPSFEPPAERFDPDALFTDAAPTPPTPAPAPPPAPTTPAFAEPAPPPAAPARADLPPPPGAPPPPAPPAPPARPDLPPPPGAPPPPGILDGTPPPPPAPPADRELKLPPPEPKHDPFADIGQHAEGELSSEEIDRLTREALRRDRVRNRPGLLDKLFQAPDGTPPDDLESF